MNETQMRRNVDQSMKAGAAACLAQSIILPRIELLLVAKDAQRGDLGAYDMLVRAMSRFVFSEAYASYRSWRTHLQPQDSFDDVFAAGLEGLHKATMKFDPSTGNAFTTYAKAWVRNACQRSVYSMVGIVHIPEKRLTAGGGYSPDDPLIKAMSLERRDPMTGRELHEDLPSPPSGAPFDVDMVRGILDVLTCVDPRLPQIVELLSREVAYREIARIVGISIDRVRELQAAGAAAVEASGLAADYLD